MSLFQLKNKLHLIAKKSDKNIITTEQINALNEVTKSKTESNINNNNISTNISRNNYSKRDSFNSIKNKIFKKNDSTRLLTREGNISSSKNNNSRKIINKDQKVNIIRLPKKKSRSNLQKMNIKDIKNKVNIKKINQFIFI